MKVIASGLWGVKLNNWDNKMREKNLLVPFKFNDF